MQSGKPVGVLRTHEWAPRVLIANSNLVPRLGHLGGVPPARAPRTDDVRPDDRRLVDLHRHPGHPPGHLRDLRRGRREALRRHPRRHDHAHRRARRDGRRAAAGGHHERRRRDLRRVSTRRRIDRRIEHRYLDVQADDARRRRSRWRSRPATRGGRCRSVSSATPPTSCPRSLAQDAPIDIVTDQTSAHDPLDYLPRRHRVRGVGGAARDGPRRCYTERARSSMAAHVKAMVEFLDKGAEVFDYGNTIRDEARKGGFARAFEFPGFVPAYIRPLFCEGKGPFRWAALSGDPADIAATDKADPRAVSPEREQRQRAPSSLDPHGRRAGAVPGAAGADLLAGLRRAAPGRAEVQRDGGLRASSRARS